MLDEVAADRRRARRRPRARLRRRVRPADPARSTRSRSASRRCCASPSAAPVVVVAGNHDSPDLFEALAPLLRPRGVHLIGAIKRPDRGRRCSGPTCWACPRSSPGSRSCARDASSTSCSRRASGTGAYADKVGRDHGCATTRRWSRRPAPTRCRSSMAHFMVNGVRVDRDAPRGERELHMGDAYTATAQAIPPGPQYVAMGHIHAPQPVPGRAGAGRVRGLAALARLRRGRGDASAWCSSTSSPAGSPRSRSCRSQLGRPLVRVTGDWDAIEARADELADAFLDLTVRVERHRPRRWPSGPRDAFPFLVKVRASRPDGARQERLVKGQRGWRRALRRLLRARARRGGAAPSCSRPSARCSRRPMRPLELTVEGFRSYRGRVTFDWRDRRLVGIVGPIGAGKSSILDADRVRAVRQDPRHRRRHQVADPPALRRGARGAHVRGRRRGVEGGAGPQAQGAVGPPARAPGERRRRRRDDRDRGAGGAGQRARRGAARHGLPHVLPVGAARAEPVRRLPEGDPHRARQGAEGCLRLRAARRREGGGRSTRRPRGRRARGPAARAGRDRRGTLASRRSPSSRRGRRDRAQGLRRRRARGRTARRGSPRGRGRRGRRGRSHRRRGTAHGVDAPGRRGRRGGARCHRGGRRRRACPNGAGRCRVGQGSGRCRARIGARAARRPGTAPIVRAAGRAPRQPGSRPPSRPRRRAWAPSPPLAAAVAALEEARAAVSESAAALAEAGERVVAAEAATAEARAGARGGPARRDGARAARPAHRRRALPGVRAAGGDGAETWRGAEGGDRRHEGVRGEPRPPSSRRDPTGTPSPPTRRAPGHRWRRPSSGRTTRPARSTRPPHRPATPRRSSPR